MQDKPSIAAAFAPKAPVRKARIQYPDWAPVWKQPGLQHAASLLWRIAAEEDNYPFSGDKATFALALPNLDALHTINDDLKAEGHPLADVVDYHNIPRAAELNPHVVDYLKNGARLNQIASRRYREFVPSLETLASVAGGAIGTNSDRAIGWPSFVKRMGKLGYHPSELERAVVRIAAPRRGGSWDWDNLHETEPGEQLPLQHEYWHHGDPEKAAALNAAALGERVQNTRSRYYLSPAHRFEVPSTEPESPEHLSRPGTPVRKAAVTLGQPIRAKTHTGEQVFHHDFHDEGGKAIGRVSVIPRGDDLHVHWAGMSGAGADSTDVQGLLGADGVRSLHRQLAEAYPDQRFVTGKRITGMGAGNHVRVPLRKARLVAALKRLAKGRDDAPRDSFLADKGDPLDSHPSGDAHASGEPGPTGVRPFKIREWDRFIAPHAEYHHDEVVSSLGHRPGVSDLDQYAKVPLDPDVVSYMESVGHPLAPVFRDAATHGKGDGQEFHGGTDSIGGFHSKTGRARVWAITKSNGSPKKYAVDAVAHASNPRIDSHKIVRTAYYDPEEMAQVADSFPEELADKVHAHLARHGFQVEQVGDHDFLPPGSAPEELSPFERRKHEGPDVTKRVAKFARYFAPVRKASGEHAAMLRHIQANQDDLISQLVHSDYLEEQWFPALASLVRRSHGFDQHPDDRPLGHPDRPVGFGREGQLEFGSDDHPGVAPMTVHYTTETWPDGKKGFTFYRGQGFPALVDGRYDPVGGRSEYPSLSKSFHSVGRDLFDSLRAEASRHIVQNDDPDSDDYVAEADADAVVDRHFNPPPPAPEPETFDGAPWRRSRPVRKAAFLSADHPAMATIAHALDMKTRRANNFEVDATTLGVMADMMQEHDDPRHHIVRQAAEELADPNWKAPDFSLVQPFTARFGEGYSHAIQVYPAHTRGKGHGFHVGMTAPGIGLGAFLHPEQAKAFAGEMDTIDGSQGLGEFVDRHTHKDEPTRRDRLVSALKRLARERPVRKSAADMAAFAASIARDRMDHLPGLVYADYLDEGGLPGVAEIIRRRSEETAKGVYHAVAFRPAPWTEYDHLPEIDHGVPGAYLGPIHSDGPDADALVNVGVLMNAPGVRFPDENGVSQPLFYGLSTTPEDAHRLLSGMPGVRNADRAVRDLEMNFPHLKPDDAEPNVPAPSRKAKSRLRTAVRKLARQQDFISTLRMLRSKQQTQLHAVAKDIAKSLNLDPAKTRDAVHDGAGGAVPSIAQAVWNAPDKDHVRYAAAWYGLLTKTPTLAVFHAAQSGPDSLYKFRFQGSADDLRAQMDRENLPSRVLMPTKDGYDVLIADEGKRQRDAVAKFAKARGLPVEESQGKMELHGASDPADARADYRKTITKFEQGPSRRSRAETPVRMARSGAHEYEAGFHAAMDENPHDTTTPMVYADWLDEQGRPALAKLIRTYVEQGVSEKRPTNNGLSSRPYFGTDEYMTTREMPPGHVHMMVVKSLDARGKYIPDHHTVTIQLHAAHKPGKMWMINEDLHDDEARELVHGLHSEGATASQGTKDAWGLAEEPEQKSRFSAAFRGDKPERMAMSDQQAFHHAIAAHPDDSTTYGVYADYLDEQGKPELAKIFRDRHGYMDRGFMGPPPFRRAEPWLYTAEMRRGEPFIAQPQNWGDRGASPREILIHFPVGDHYFSMYSLPGRGRPEESHAVLRGLESEGVHGAKEQADALEAMHPHLRQPVGEVK